jgi:hypothetical protein
LVGKAENLITTRGRLAILRSLAQGSQVAQTLAVGAGTTAATVGDTRLTFEVARATLSTVSIDITTNKIIYKTTIPRETVLNIREAGLWSVAQDLVAGQFGSNLITSFESDFETWSVGTYQTANARVGSTALRLSPTASATVSSVNANFVSNLSGHSGSDLFVLALNCSSANCAAARVRFISPNGGYYQFQYSTPASGYNVLSLAKSAATVSGTPSWSDITSMEVQATATAGGSVNVDFDGLRVEDVDSFNPDYALISRTVLGTPIAKTAVAAMDIEYTLDVTIS